MNTDAQTPRRSGPHAPQPAASESTPAATSATDQSSAPDAAQKVFEEMDPRQRAAIRAAELLDQVAVTGDAKDKFYIDPKIIPDGWSYEYKMFTVLGKEDPSYQVSLADGGWEAVPARRHPELMPIGYQGGTILRDGMILMERPAAITDMRKQRDAKAARDQVRAKEQSLGAPDQGQFERDNKGSPMVKINRSYEPMQIPKE